MTIAERMQAGLDRLFKRFNGRRPPKAFYLVPDDWAEFCAWTDGEEVTLPFGNNPTFPRTDKAFKGIPVRESKSKITSRLYDWTSIGSGI